MEGPYVWFLQGKLDGALDMGNKKGVGVVIRNADGAFMGVHAASMPCWDFSRRNVLYKKIHDNNHIHEIIFNVVRSNYLHPRTREKNPIYKSRDYKEYKIPINKH